MNAPVFFFSLHLMIMRASWLGIPSSVKITYQTLVAAFRHIDSLLVVLMITPPLNQIEPGLLHIFPCYFGMSSMTC